MTLMHSITNLFSDVMMNCELTWGSAVPHFCEAAEKLQIYNIMQHYINYNHFKKDFVKETLFN